MKIKQNEFVVVHEGNIVNVFLGDPKEIGLEAEFVLALHETYIPNLIFTLKNIGH